MAKLNLVRMLITTCGLFIFGNLPIAFSDIIKQFDREIYSKFSYFNNVATFLYHSSDVFVYYTFNKHFRMSFKKSFYCITSFKKYLNLN